MITPEADAELLQLFQDEATERLEATRLVLKILHKHVTI